MKIEGHRRGRGKTDMILTVKRTTKSFLRRIGYEIRRIEETQCTDKFKYAELSREYFNRFKTLQITKVHYGCGSRYLGEGWVNIDTFSKSSSDISKAYISADLRLKHPFPCECFRFGFAEDFLEHLDQRESLLFLSEVFRTLRPNGVLRLSFPGFPGVLRFHCKSSNWDEVFVGLNEAYTKWGHKHFYCQESLSLVARYLGFSDVRFVEYGRSAHQELCNLDSRADQKYINIYAELTK